ncbi:MAG: M1 family aminopeptidase [Candidatus Aminicenantes bacterium]
MIPNSDHTEYRIEHQPSQVIEISYEVSQYWDQPIDRDVYYRPIINETYFHFIGHGVFVYPEWDEKVKRKISLEWRGIHDDWIMANSFDIQNKNRLLEISIAELCHAAYMAGDFVLDECRVKGYPLYIVQRGTWNFTPSEFSNMVETVVKAVRGFWNDYDFPYFLVTLIPTDNEQSKGGTGLTNSFETFVSADHESADDLKFLLAHELFHTWNGRKIQREEPEELVYWFSEGFTNYYTRLILLRNKLITLKEYISDYNRAIKEYYFSPAIHSTNEDILKKTHTDRHIERIPYLRGDLLATRWNALIKKSSSYSLDDVMFDILASAQKSNMLVSAENVDLHVRRYLKSGIMEDLEKFVNKGEIIVPGENDLGPCIELTEEKFHRFDIGFEYLKSKITRDWHVTKVNPKGPAFKAGLRENDTIVGRSIYWDRTEMPVKVKFKNQSGEIKTIEYLPRGELIQVPQYRLRDEISEMNDCLGWFDNHKKSRKH